MLTVRKKGNCCDFRILLFTVNLRNRSSIFINKGDFAYYRNGVKIPFLLGSIHRAKYTKSCNKVIALLDWLLLNRDLVFRNILKSNINKAFKLDLRLVRLKINVMKGFQPPWNDVVHKYHSLIVPIMLALFFSQD